MHGALSDFLLELVQNSVEANAKKIEIMITTDAQMVMRITDDGGGMDQATVLRAIDPFFSSGKKHRRRQGLGLAFLKQAAEAANGSVTITSVVGCGTTVTAVFDATHIDCPPLGNLAQAMVDCLHLAEDQDVVFTRTTHEASYQCTRSELVAALDGLQTAQQLTLAERYIAAQEAALVREGGKK